MNANRCPNCGKPGEFLESWEATPAGQPTRIRTRYECPSKVCAQLLPAGRCAGKRGAWRNRVWIVDSLPVESTVS